VRLYLDYEFRHIFPDASHRWPAKGIWTGKLRPIQVVFWMSWTINWTWWWRWRWRCRWTRKSCATGSITVDKNVPLLAGLSPNPISRSPRWIWPYGVGVSGPLIRGQHADSFPPIVGYHCGPISTLREIKTLAVTHWLAALLAHRGPRLSPSNASPPLPSRNAGPQPPAQFIHRRCA